LAGFIAVGCPALAQTRLGLHVTQEELNIWRQRAQKGPYKSAGDVSPNSPGNWDRIVANRNAFAANPSNGRAVAPFLTNGQYVTGNGNTYSWPEPGDTNVHWSMRLRDAAFYDLVMGVTTDHAAIKQELLWISSQSFTNWAAPNGIWRTNDGPQGEVWQPGDTAPTFGITAWLMRILHAYDYMGRVNFTQTELNQLDRWFFDAAEYWHYELDSSLTRDIGFQNRLAGDYTLVFSCSGGVQLWAGGPLASGYAQAYNNRRGSIVRFTALASLYLTLAGRNYTDGRFAKSGVNFANGSLSQLVQLGKLFVQEWVRFSVFPVGAVGDYERREDHPGIPDNGWGYAGSTIAQMVYIADAFARAGDLSLYNYNTALGACDTVGTINDGGSRKGQNRDILFAVQAHMKYITDQYARYYPSNDSPTDANRIDGRDPRNGSNWNDARDHTMVMGNIFFKDAFIKQAYTRTHPNSIPYPSSPAYYGWPPYTGEMGIFPGVMFMFGQMEGLVDPYSGGATKVPPAAPSNLTFSATP
jgi:hypothetical protein